MDAIVPAGGASGIVDNSAGSTIDVDVAAMPAGSSVLVTVSGALAAAVEPGDAIPNTATLVWTSLPGDGTASNPTGSTVPGDAGDDDGERDGSGGVNDLRVTATAQLAVAGVTATKSIVATSEAHTTGSSVAVGEIVRYRLVAMLPEGTATAVTFVDLLPNGLRALTDGTARVALVSDSVPITSSTLADPPLGGLVAVGDETTIDAVTPVATLPPGALSAGPGSGADLTVSLGDLTNAERDADDEFVVVEFNALVDNTAVNDDGTTRNNRFRVQVDGATAATSPNVPVTVREPRLTLAKTFPGAASPDAGDTVPVRIVATNAGSATAFEPVLSDALPAGMTPQPPVSVTVPAGVTVLDDTVSGDTVTVALDRLAPGQSVTVEFDVVLDDDIAPGLALTNTATARWTSLPGTGTVANATGSVTAGASGDATGERNGSGGAVNDHASSDDAILTTRDVEATKVLTGTDRAHTTGSALAIGEEATFTATVTIPEGVTPAAVFTDAFDTPGFELVSVAASFGADLSAATPDPTPSTSAGSVELDFGDITNAPDGITDAEDQLVVTVVLRAANVAGNDDGVTIANTSAALRWTGGSSISGLVATSVVEPELVVTKSMSPTEADAGDTVTVTVSVAHAPGSTADAFDVELTDTIPSGLSYVPASVSDTGPVAADSLSGSASSIDAAGARSRSARSAPSASRPRWTATSPPARSSPTPRRRPGRRCPATCRGSAPVTAASTTTPMPTPRPSRCRPPRSTSARWPATMRPRCCPTWWWARRSPTRSTSRSPRGSPARSTWWTTSPPGWRTSRARRASTTPASPGRSRRSTSTSRSATART